MKKITELKLRFKQLFRKPFAAMTLLTTLTLPMSSMQAQTVIKGNESDLQTAIRNTSSDGTVTIGNISMRYNHDGILIGGDSSGGIKTNLTIKGTTASDFSTKINKIVAQILSENDNTINGTNVNNIFTPTSIDTSSLSSYITGNNQIRNITDTSGYANGYKWFTTTSNVQNGTPSGSNGLGFQDISFQKVTVEYKNTSSGERKFVNGLIGNRYNAGSLGDSLQGIPGSLGEYGTSLGKLTGNEFSDITIKVVGTKDTNYLAGGGIIGVRNT
ncbi:MAG: hypothetical protein LBP87_01410, partial [Planctomycetaceae bacterium]|nr:hypothetical protein [Planctomycetaceae bacterium]